MQMNERFQGSYGPGLRWQEQTSHCGLMEGAVKEDGQAEHFNN